MEATAPVPHDSSLDQRMNAIERQMTVLNSMLNVHDREDTNRFAQIGAQVAAMAEQQARRASVKWAWQEATGMVRMALIIVALLLGQGHTPGELIKAIMEAIQ